jgi:hypothetical protein
MIRSAREVHKTSSRFRFDCLHRGFSIPPTIMDGAEFNFETAPKIGHPSEYVIEAEAWGPHCIGCFFEIGG